MNQIPGKREIFLFLIFSFTYYFLFTYKSFSNFFYFDDLDTLSWIHGVSNLGLLRDTFDLSFFFDKSFYRPFGSLLHGLCLELFGLNFLPFHIVATSIHLFNIGCLYILISKFVPERFAVSLGAFLFVFHAALMPIYWYFYGTFDSLCASFLLLSFLLYIKRAGRFNLQYFFSLLCFFLALRCKEMALSFPLVLTSYEVFIVGKDSAESPIKRICRALWPFYTISAIAGLLKLSASIIVVSTTAYALHFDFISLIRGLHFFVATMLQFPFLPLIVSLLILILLGVAPIILRSRTLAFAYFFTLISLLPILPLANRREGYHLYIPLIGVSLYAAEFLYCIRRRIKQNPRGDTFYLNLVALMFLFVYITVNWEVKGYVEKQYITIASENRSFYELATRFRSRPGTSPHVLYDSAPPALMSADAVFAVFHLLSHDYEVNVEFIPDCKGNLPEPVESDTCCVSYKNRTIQIWRAHK